MKIKRRKTDIMYAKYLRMERGYRCERCSKIYQEGDGLWGLQVSHFYGRAKESVRFDPENTDLLCMGCHRYFTSNPNEYVEWKKKKMGIERFKVLTLRANTPGKRDDGLMEITIKEMIKHLDVTFQ